MGTDIKKLSNLKEFLKEKDVDSCDICIVGSAILAFKGIRTNNDLEIITKNRTVYHKLTGKRKESIWGQHEVADGIDCFSNFFSFCGINDKVIFQHKLYEEKDGLLFARLEIEYLYKQSLIKLIKREKDIKDLWYISNYHLMDREKVYKYKKQYASLLISIVSGVYYKMYRMLNMFVRM